VGGGPASLRIRNQPCIGAEAIVAFVDLPRNPRLAIEFPHQRFQITARGRVTYLSVPYFSFIATIRAGFYGVREAAPMRTTATFNQVAPAITDAWTAGRPASFVDGKRRMSVNDLLSPIFVRLAANAPWRGMS
jgi:hypothetical protein